MLDEGVVGQVRLAPEVWCVVEVGVLDAVISGLQEVALSSGLSLSLCVDILDSSVLEQLL